MDKLSLLQDWLNKNSYTIYNSFKHKLPDVNEKNFKYYVLKELDSFETFSFKNFSKNSMVYEGIKSGQILIFLLLSIPINEFVEAFFRHLLTSVFYSNDIKKELEHKIEECIGLSQKIGKKDSLEFVSYNLATKFLSIKLHNRETKMDYNWFLNEIDSLNSSLLLAVLQYFSMEELFEKTQNSIEKLSLNLGLD